MSSTKTIARRLTPLVVVAAFLGAIGLSETGRAGSNSPAEVLGEKVSSSATCTGISWCIATPDPGPELYPGATASAFPITITNNATTDILVQSITIEMTNTLPQNCDITNFKVNGDAFSASTHKVELTTTKVVAKGSSDTYQANTTLRLANVAQSQDACAGTDLAFSYTGSAYYSDPTTTTLVASPTMAAFGQPVSLTATVQPTYSNTTPNSGSVNFFLTGNSTPLAGSPVNVTNGQATLSVTSLPSGHDSVYAVYTAATSGSNGGPDYLDSQSSPVSVTVSSPCITTKKSLKNVTSGQFICIGSGGTAQGGTTVHSGGTLIVLVGGTASGGLTVQAGGGLIVAGGSVSGGLTSTGAALLQICGGNLSGGTTVQQSNTFVLIGDGGDDGSPACPGNNITGGLKVLNNTQGVEVGGNSITGGLTWTANSGSGPSADDTTPELEGNSISGGLTCSGTSTSNLTNDSQPNSVSGPRKGTEPCTTAGF